MKILVKEGGEFPQEYGEIRAYACKRPKMTDHRGRAWDSFGKVIIDGKEYRALCDTTWGWYAYFEKDGKCYKFKF